MSRHYITHIIPEHLPETGMRRLFFYTTTDEGIRLREYYLGTDNYPIALSKIEQLVSRGKLIPLPQMLELAEDKSIWVDSDGVVYYADLEKPMNGRKLVFRPRELSKAYQSYQESMEEIKGLRVHWGKTLFQ